MLLRSLSPSSQESGNKNYHSYHHLGSNMELSSLPNYAAISRTIEDIEFDSDGDTLCSNMNISSSSEDETQKMEKMQILSHPRHIRVKWITSWLFWRT